MKIVKLPSGSYRVQKMINGKRHSLTFDHRPTKHEIESEIASRSGAFNGKMTFNDAALSYIEARTNTLSPATIREYKGTLRQLDITFKNKYIDAISQNDVQKEVNRLSSTRAPKTVRNYHGFIAGVLAEFRPELILRTSLPQKEKKDVYIPQSEDIKALLNSAKGTPMELPILLGCCGMRRGEICALTMDDIDGNTININKSLVLDENKKWVIKQPKTTESTRSLVVDDYIIRIINERGLYTGHPGNISDWMDKKEKELGLPHFSLHKLRHYFASKAHENGISDADILKDGGWSTDYVMKNIYRHSLEQESNRAVSSVIGSIL